MARAPKHSTPRHGFAVRRLDELLPAPAASRDWDVRFVSAVLLFYGLIAVSFYLVDWLNDAPADPALEVTQPFDRDGASDAARTPYLMRLPRLLKDQAADDAPRESR